jgi:hypothetical protein
MRTSKKITFGKVAYNGTRKTNLVELELSLNIKDGKPVFSASGNVWNNLHTDIYMGGQCIDSIYKEYRSQLANLPLYRKIMGLWERNHLSDMNAGTAEQTAAIRAWEANGNKYEYTAVCEYLKSIGLYEVQHEGKPYRYGHGWVYREISPSGLEQINSLLTA